MILSPAEQIKEYTEKGWWGTETLIDLFAKNVAATPDAVAVVDPPNRLELTGGASLRFTYRELNERVERLAAALFNLGIRKDDIIVVQLPNIVELVGVYLATAHLGAILSPVAVQYRTHELKQILTLTQPKAYITTTNFANFNFVEMAKQLQLEFPALKTIIALGKNVPSGVLSLSEILETPQATQDLKSYLASISISANDIATICWTSGTEAEPKGVPRSHNHWISIAYTSTDGAELQPRFNLLNPFPMVNMSAIGGMLVPWLQTGGKLVMHQPFSLPVFRDQITAEKINYTVAPPVLLNLLLRNPALLANADLSTMTNIGSGSAPLSPWMTTEWKNKHGKNILNFFGSNEGTGFVSGPRDIPDAAERARFFPRYGVSGFKWNNRVTLGMSTKLVGLETKKEITEPNVVGELAVKGPSIFSGYYKRPELTQKSFDADGYFHTGDLFAIDGAGNDRYRFVGRLKDVIIRGGMNISPEEVENLLLEHPKIQDVAIIGIPQEKLGDEVVCAVAVPKKDQTVTLAEINDFLKEKDIAAYKFPRKLIAVAELPRNQVGKVLKRSLKELAVAEKT